MSDILVSFMSYPAEVTRIIYRKDAIESVKLIYEAGIAALPTLNCAVRATLDRLS